MPAWRRRAPWARSCRSASRRRRRSWSSNVHEAPAPCTSVRAWPGRIVAPIWCAPVSSTKTSVSGSRSGCVLDPGPPAPSTSARCCSRRCAGPPAVEEGPHGALRDPQTVLVFQMGGNLRQGMSGVSSIRARTTVARTSICASVGRRLRPRRQLPVRCGIDPLDRRDGAMPKRFAAPGGSCRHQQPPSPPGDAIIRKRSCHAGWPPSPARILNHISAIENSNDSLRSKIALTRISHRVMAARPGRQARRGAQRDAGTSGKRIDAACRPESAALRVRPGARPPRGPQP